MGHAHVTHENRLFMKDPIQQISTDALASGLRVKSQKQGVVHEGQPFKTHESKMSIREYKLTKQREQAIDHDDEQYDASSVLMGKDSIYFQSELSGLPHIDDEVVTQDDQHFLTKDPSALYLNNKHINISAKKS